MEDTIDPIGSFRDAKYTIETRFGKLFSILDPRVEDIDINVIAHSLSLICRYNGHCSKFYSVAEHSCHVSTVLLSQGYDTSIQMMGLLHDAAETYTGDVIRPIKNIPQMAEYRKIQNRVEEVIWNWSGLKPTKETSKIITLADNIVLKAEAKVLVHSGGRNWLGMEKIPDHPVQFWFELPFASKFHFLYLYNLLKA
jgi:hypothetical protein